MNQSRALAGDVPCPQLHYLASITLFQNYLRMSSWCFDGRLFLVVDFALFYLINFIRATSKIQARYKI